MSYLENMRKGEEARDATPKIRGFLFQDYYTIELLFSKKKTTMFIILFKLNTAKTKL